MEMMVRSTATPSFTEMDAAHALLQLHYDVRLGSHLVEPPNSRETEAENTVTAAFYLTRLFDPAATSSPYKETSEKHDTEIPDKQQNHNFKPNGSKFNHHDRMETLINNVRARRNGVRKDLEPAFLKRLNVMKRRPSKSFVKYTSRASSSEPDSHNNHIQLNNVKVYSKPQTRETGTQTTDFIQMELDAAKAKIKDLYEQLNALEAQIRMCRCKPLSFEEDYSTDESDENYEVKNKNRRKNSKSSKSSMEHTDISSPQVTRESVDISDNDTSQTKENRSTRSKKEQGNRDVTKSNKNGDLVPIGEGYAKVPSRVLKYINWNSYTSATRKLLTATFSRRVLATHSLTGKPSPAFPDKPAKKKLDPILVHDIVQTVAAKCHVPINVVRTSITTKCADESKMFHTRQQNKKKRQRKKNRENIPPPATSDSDE